MASTHPFSLDARLHYCPANGDMMRPPINFCLTHHYTPGALTDETRRERRIRVGIYEDLGVRRLINAWGSVTILGGSLMPEPVLAAMREAAGSFVTLRELQDRAGTRIAELVGVEAALISSGAAGGITLAAAACITGTDQDRIHRLPDTDGLANEIVVAQSGRPNYMYQAAEHVGARLVQVGSADRLTPDDFAAAIGPRTAAVLLIVATLDHQQLRSPGVTATIENISAVAHRAGVPVIVDAAAELPPSANFRAFLEQGADLAIFSGGKALRGPQSTGLILGQRDLIEAAALNNNPNSAIGRPMKVGKEEIAGLVKAVELYVQRDEEAELARWNAVAGRVAERLAGLPGVHGEVVVSGMYARPPITPVCLVHLDRNVLGLSHDEVHRRLLEGEPGVGVGRFDGGLIVNPMMLADGEEEIVARRIREVLSA